MRVAKQDALLNKKNSPVQECNGIYRRWLNPIITREHIPLNWRYDLNVDRNPFLMERIGVNATFNSGAIYWRGKFLLMVRVEGNDRKSFFAIAESENGVDGFKFRSHPVLIPSTDPSETNYYDMRLVKHDDGYIYGFFCVEQKDTEFPDDLSAAVAQCGIVRTEDLENWERLPNLQTKSPQQRNVVVHPEFIDGKYALFTRPQDEFIKAGGSGYIAWGLCDSLANPVVSEEIPVDKRVYHAINESKNGLGPAPIKTEHGWLHLAHGVRNTAAGLRYVLYMFMTDLAEPWRITHKPGGHLLAPSGNERVGDVSNVVFSNGWIRTPEDKIYIYYASSDTRMHVATSSVAQLIDYCVNTPPDSMSSAGAVETINRLIESNESC